MSEPKLAFENVSKVRRTASGGDVAVLRDVSLELPEGEITVVVGPSGGGKSTLLRLVNRLNDCSGGRILLSGEDVANIDPLELRRRAGMVLQKPFMFEGSVLDNLRQPFLLRGVSPPPRNSAEMVRALEGARLSGDLLERKARELSVGQQQRVSLARTLLTEPELLLLDEPTSALDRPTALALVDLLRETCRAFSLTILMVTHDLKLAERIADRAAFLDEGRILEEGTPAEVFQQPRTDPLKRFLAEPVTKGG